MKAFSVSIKTWGYNQTIIAAKTPGQAKSLLCIAANEAGFKNVEFTDFSAKRAPKFDDIATSAAAQETLGWSDGINKWGCLSE